LKENVGHPWTTMPDNMFHHAAGGYAGQGTLCGSLGACSSIINLVTMDDEKSHNKLIADLINWYTTYNHPTDEFDSVCKFPGQMRMAPNSPLCHVSVSTWTVGAGTEIGSKERKDRCAKVAGRVAMQTVMMLNDYVDGKFTPAAKDLPENTSSCLECHGPDGDHNQQGKMNCNLCHTQTPDHAG